MKREDIRIGQLVRVEMVGRVTSIGARVGIKPTNSTNPFDINDIEARAEFVEPFEPDKNDEAVNANGK